MALQTLSSDCKSIEIVAAIERDGACIVRDLLSPDEVAAINDDTAPWIERTDPVPHDFAGHKTRRTGALISRCPTTRPVVMQPTILEAAGALLGPYCERIQLHLTQTIAIMKGEGEQPLHRDRLVWGGYLPNTIEPQCNTLWALTDFTLENGATRLVPGSHKWDGERSAKPEEIVRAEMGAGSVLLYSGSVIHGGGRNQTERTRIGLNITYCLGWLRQEENQFLSCPPEVAKTLDPELADLLGYTMGNYALGYYASPEAEGARAGVLPPEAALGRMPTSLPELDPLGGGE